MQPFDEPTGNPMQVYREWLADAEVSEPNDPSAAALATASLTGLPNVRMVLTKGAEDRGIRFFSNSGSQKGEEIRENPEAAMCFHWKTLRRQVRFIGHVEQISREETATYFHSRSRGSQIAAAISVQSRLLTSRQALDDAVRAYTAHLNGTDVPLPEHWSGYLLVPRLVEFWKDGEDRRHDRIRFSRSCTGWQAELLYP